MGFVEEHFLNPMRYPEAYAPYNWVNTLVYAGLAVVAACALYKLLKHYGFNPDEKLAKAVIPFVLFGSALRVITDAGILPRTVYLAGVELHPFISPGIYFVTFAVILAGFGVARLLKGDWLRNAFGLGAVLAIIPLAALLPFYEHFGHAVAISVAPLIALAAYEFAWKKRGIKKDLFERLAIFGQVLDGSASFIGIQFGTPAQSYFEQHVVGGAIMSASPALFLLVKLAFAFAVVELLRREDKDSQERRFILLLVAIFGFAPGLRDLLRIVCGV